MVLLRPDSSGCSSFSSAGAHPSGQAAFELTQGGEVGARTPPMLSVGSKNEPLGQGIPCGALQGQAEPPPEAPAAEGARVCRAPFGYLSLQEPNDSVSLSVRLWF